MKVIYLKSETQEALIADLKQVFTEWDGVSMDFSEAWCHGHYIGQIVESWDGETPIFKEGYHANVLVPDDFDSPFGSEFTPSPETPSHMFMGYEIQSEAMSPE